MFDASDLSSLARDWVPLAWFALVDGVCGLAALGKIPITGIKNPRASCIVASGAFLWFFVITTVIGIGLVGSAVAARQKLVTHQCRIVEGHVTGFKPIPFEKGFERFEVGGRTFAYKGDETQAGYRATFGTVGPIRDGALVRLCAYEGIILKLEVAG